MTYADAEDELLSEISKLTNPTVKRKLLGFADECDSAAVHMKAAALPLSRVPRLFLPLTKMKETEIYAPTTGMARAGCFGPYPMVELFEIPVPDSQQ